MSKTSRKSSKSLKTSKPSTKSKFIKQNAKHELIKAKPLTTWHKIWCIALSITVPLGGGIIISLFTRDTMTKFGAFNQPPLAPPAWLFPVAWTILYTLMGLASYFIWTRGHLSNNKETKKTAKIALALYSIQLLFNFAWTPLFFNFDLFWFAFVWLLIMWTIILVLVIKTYKISKPAFWMLLPYLLWCTFAAYLNCGIAILN